MNLKKRIESVQDLPVNAPARDLGISKRELKGDIAGAGGHGADAGISKRELKVWPP